MGIFLTTLCLLSILQSTRAIALSTILPTGTHYVTSKPPQPTPEMKLHRRNAFTTTGTILTGTPNACGWHDTYIDPDAPNTFACQDSSSCVYHMSNSAFSGLVGCCSGQHCGFESVCYNAAQVTATPSLTSGNIAFALFCTNSTSPSCGTYTWPGAALTDYVCDTTTFVSNIYTVATWGEPEDGKILWATQYITKIDDETMSMYSSLYDTSTSVSKPNRQATSTRSITAATTTAQPTASSSGSSGSSISSGTIAGSVVGSIACAGVIGAGVVFLLWKRRKSRQQDGLNDPAQVQYQSVPKDQSDHSEWGIQQAVEVEASDSVHKMAEAPGSTPHNASQEVSSNAFIAELPSPDDGKHH